MVVGIRVFLLVFLLLCESVSYASDEFSAVRCDSDIPKALVGQHMGNGKVAVTEARHKDLGLKDLGASMITDDLHTIYWQICGNEFVLLVRRSVIRDVLQVPPHSKLTPEFTGECQRQGEVQPGVIFAILDNRNGGDPLAATAAWLIDDKKAKFVKLPTANLTCPRDGIATEDGGL